MRRSQSLVHAQEPVGALTGSGAHSRGPWGHSQAGAHSGARGGLTGSGAHSGAVMGAPQALVPAQVYVGLWEPRVGQLSILAKRRLQAQGPTTLSGGDRRASQVMQG